MEKCWPLRTDTPVERFRVLLAILPTEPIIGVYRIFCRSNREPLSLLPCNWRISHFNSLCFLSFEKIKCKCYFNFFISLRCCEGWPRKTIFIQYFEPYQYSLVFWKIKNWKYVANACPPFPWCIVHPPRNLVTVPSYKVTSSFLHPLPNHMFSIAQSCCGSML